MPTRKVWYSHVTDSSRFRSSGVLHQDLLHFSDDVSLLSNVVPRIKSHTAELDSDWSH